MTATTRAYSRTRRLNKRDLACTAYQVVLCSRPGCDAPVTAVNEWRTVTMPATAFFYLCAEHAGHKMPVR